MNNFKISNPPFDEKTRTFIIAELSANHLQDYSLAVRTIRSMKECGADAVKLQTFTPDTITIDCENKYFRIKHGNLWSGKSLYQLYKEAYMPWDWQPKLKRIAEDLGLTCFSSVNDRAAVDFLESIDMPAYKIPSFEITDIPLIEYVASKGKPVVLSTGIAHLNEINEAVVSCRKMGNNKIALLKCASAYPSFPEDANLAVISDLAKKFKTVVGLSDHSLSIAVPIASLFLGAKIIEKHFILNRKLGGPDAAFSLEPKEFKQMVTGVREAEMAVGKVTYQLIEKVEKNRMFARSLFVVQDIKSGQRFSQENIRSIRPGYGLPPRDYKKIIGKTAKKNIKRGTPLKWAHVRNSREVNA